MSTPIYTATAGPVDPKAPLVAKIYTVVSSLLGLVTLAQTFHLLNDTQAAGINGVASAGLGLVGAVTTALAAFRTNKQLKNGTFDPAPEPVVVAPPISTADQIVNAIPSVLQQAADGLAEVDKVKQAAADAFGNLPIVGGLAEQLINGFIPGR